MASYPVPTTSLHGALLLQPSFGLTAEPGLWTTPAYGFATATEVLSVGNIREMRRDG